MTFDDTAVITEMTNHLIAALSFAMDADADVQLSEPELVRTVINTSTWKISGEFAAGEIFGTISGTYSSKNGIANIQRISIRFDGVDAESIVHCGSAKGLLEGITNAYQIYKTRYQAKPKQYEQLVESLSKIEEAASGFACSNTISGIVASIKYTYGIDIELVDTLPKEK